MAAIDRICGDYEDYIQLWKWCIIYYPKLLVDFFNPLLTYKEFAENKEQYVSKCMYHAKKLFEQMGGTSVTADEMCKNLAEKYCENTDGKHVREEVRSCLEEYYRSKEDWEDGYKFPIATFNYKQDKLLLWRCPIPFVREYLEKQCGYKTKWYHKLFWKGNKEGFNL